MTGAARDRTPKLEWVLGLLGLLLVLGTIGFLLWQMVQDEPTYPNLRIEAVEVERQEHAWLVVLRVVNSGGATAQGVQIEGRLRLPERVETSGVTLDYVPAGSSRRAGLYFHADPGNHPLELRAEGYQEP